MKAGLQWGASQDPRLVPVNPPRGHWGREEAHFGAELPQYPAVFSGPVTEERSGVSGEKAIDS